MNGLIVEAYGAAVGSDNDYRLQNDSQLGAHLSALQVGQVPVYVSGSDKGLHLQQCIIPMHNNAVNTPAEDFDNTAFSRARATCEWDVGRPASLFKYIDSRKVLLQHLQPIGLFFRVCCVMTNALTILDGNGTSEFYECATPTFASYFFP